MKRIFALTFLLSSVAPLFSQVPKEKTLLWEITGPGITKPSYLYGTMHLSCPDDIVLSPKLLQKFNTAQQLYLELDMDDPNLMAQMMNGVMMKDSSSLTNLLGKSEYDSVAAVFQKTTGIPLLMMNKMKPALAISAIYPSLLGCAMEGWEKRFTDLAKGKKLNIKGLETIDQQMDVFDSIPYKVQAQMLAKTMLNLDSTKKSFHDLLALYKAKDIQGLQQMMDDDKDFSEYDNILLQDRNTNWIPKIINESKRMPSFFAFGAAHLGGKDGVIYLLRAKGYSVKPVYY